HSCPRVAGAPRLDYAAPHPEERTMTLDVARRFDAMAATYDVLEPWYEHLYEVMHRILRLTLARGGGRALDAGCGTGFQAALLRGFGYETHGLDIAAGIDRKSTRLNSS